MNCHCMWKNNSVDETANEFIADVLGDQYDQIMAKQMKCEEVNYYYECWYNSVSKTEIPCGSPGEKVWCGPKVVNFISMLLSAPKEQKRTAPIMMVTSAKNMDGVDSEEYLWKGKDGKVTKSWVEDQDSDIIGDNPEYNELWLGDLDRDMDIICSDSLFLVIYNLMRGDWVVKQTWRSKIRDKYLYIVSRPQVWWDRWRDHEK